MAPEIFGWQHLTYFAVVIVAMVVSLFCIKKFVKTEKTLFIIIKSVAGALLLAIIWNRICVAVKNNDAMQLIPNTFCGLSSLVLSLTVLIGKKDCGMLHFISYIGFIGGVITLFYPDFIGQNVSFFYPATISGLLHHTIMVYLIVLMVLTKWFVPTIKKWQWLPLGLACFMTYGIFLITALNFSSAMYITEPLLSGTIFTWWFTGILVLVLSYAIMLTFEYFNVWRKNKNTNNEN